jgi:hypothetical protein
MKRLFISTAVFFALLIPTFGLAGPAVNDDPVEAFIGALPMPIRSNPVFVYRSRSLQGASLDSPRVILGDAKKYDPTYGSDTVYAFNGDPTHAGFDRIEAMEFDPASARFKFFEISFDGPPGQERPVRSTDNPSQCMGCHRGPDPRPNWESYDFWTGMYGSTDDRLQAVELEPFKTFLTARSSRPRYKALGLDELKKILSYTNHGGRLPGEPNITMTYKLSRANLKRVARLITETPNYQAYKFVIAGLLNQAAAGHDLIADFVPGNLRGLADYYSPDDIAGAQEIPASTGAEYSIPPTLLFRSIFESRGIDVSSWFMNFKSGSTNTFLNGVAWQEELLFELQTRDPELAQYRYLGSDIQLDEVRLADASRAAFDKLLKKSDVRNLTTFATDVEVTERIWRGACATCHSGRTSDIAPQMDFAQARAHPKLKNLVLSGAMPPDQKLTPSEKRRLLGVH